MLAVIKLNRFNLTICIFSSYSGPLARKQDSDLFVFDAKPADSFIPVQSTIASDLGVLSREEAKHLLIPHADTLGLKCFNQLYPRSLVPPLLYILLLFS